MVFHLYCSFAINIKEVTITTTIKAFIDFKIISAIIIMVAKIIIMAKIIAITIIIMGIIIIAMGFIKEIIIVMASAGQIIAVEHLKGIIILGLLSISYFSLMDYSF